MRTAIFPGQFSAFTGERRTLVEARIRFVFEHDGTPHDFGICVERIEVEWTWPVIACLASGEHEDCVFNVRLDGAIWPFHVSLPLESHVVSNGYLTIESPRLAEWFAEHYIEEAAA